MTQKHTLTAKLFLFMAAMMIALPAITCNESVSKQMKDFLDLVYASSTGNVEKVKEYLNRGIDPNFIPADAELKNGEQVGVRPLHTAAASGHVKVVEILLQHNAAATARDSSGDVPLHAAVSSEDSNLEVIETLLKARTQINIQNFHGLTPLHQAVLSRQIEKVKFLLKMGANPNLGNSRDLSPLGVSLMKKFDDITLVLLKSPDIDYQKRDSSGNTLLHLAVHFGASLNVVKSLVQLGVNLYAQNSKGMTPIFTAIVAKSYPITKFLLDSDPNPNSNILNITDNQNFSCLYMACQFFEKRIFHLLLEKGKNKGMDLNHINGNSFSALHISAFNFHTQHDVVISLLRVGANVNVKKDGTAYDMFLTKIENKNLLEVSKNIKLLIAPYNYWTMEDVQFWFGKVNNHFQLNLKWENLLSSPSLSSSSSHLQEAVNGRTFKKVLKNVVKEKRGEIEKEKEDQNLRNVLAGWRKVYHLFDLVIERTRNNEAFFWVWKDADEWMQGLKNSIKPQEILV
eukprot:TRINITY_DN7174_c0_g1_i2.p1 TRINITY_DN7174_c0_g1~~TRINITY_DN7174_c0_g1_i2.p1  ORF type:complete len:513 (-),score=129.91 TRINITY_DN7174_c0_g1_i2:57-1595(-)